MGVKNNFYYSSVLTAAGYIFPLITYPYVSRVLGVTNIGICNFVDSIINYYVLFSMMGIQTLGIREIANTGNDKAKTSRVFFSIVSLNLVLCFLFAVVLLISIQVIPQFYEYRKLLYIGVAKLFASLFLIEWLYKGLEQFRYITIRSVLVRCIYVFSVFVFVKSSDDYVVYFTLLIITELVNAAINCFHAKKYIKFSLKGLNPFRFFVPTMILGVYSLLTTMYKSFNVVFLGFVTNPTEVGYYTTSTKLHHIFLALFTAFSGVMLPRMSALVSEGNTREFKRKIEASFSLLVFVSFPLMVLGICFSSEIITIISGPEYLNATYPLIILFPLVFIIGFEQILVHQILIPLKKDRAILINSVVGAIIGISANILLVKRYGCIGSAVVWTLSEICVMLSAIIFARSFLQSAFIVKRIVVNIFYAIPAIIICCVARYVWNSGILAFFVSVGVVLPYYFILYVFILKEEIVVSVLPKRFSRIWK